ncbi:MAG: C1 family peptidase [Bacteroidota bacterium]
MKRLFFSLLIFVVTTGLGWAQEPFGYGLKLPTPEQLKKIPYAPSFGLPPNIQLPEKVDLSVDMPPIGHQGAQGSCTAFTVVYSLKSYQEKKEKNWNFVEGGKTRYDRICSPAFVFNMAKWLTNNQNCAGGIHFAEAFKVLRDYGTAFWKDFPYDPNNCTKVPDKTTIEKAKVNKISAAQALTPANLAEIKYNLWAKKPVMLGVSLESDFQAKGFEAFKNKTHYTYQLRGPIFTYYHAMLCVGYDDNKKVFKVMNSWGNQWGNAGYVDIPYSVFVKAVRESYTMNDAYRVPGLAAPGQAETSDSSTVNSSLFYSSWFKEGYYREYKNIRMTLLDLDTDDQVATVKFTDNITDDVIEIISYEMDTPLTFYHRGQKITFSLNSIGKAGRNPFKKAAFFTVVIDESIDNEFQIRLDQLELLREQEIQVNEVIGRYKLLTEF